MDTGGKRFSGRLKKCAVLLLAAGLLCSAQAGTANAIDFKMQGEWIMGFALGDTSLVRKEKNNHVNTEDRFNAGHRLRLQLDAVASENLSGTVLFEIGETRWGQSETGGAANERSTKALKVKNAYLDWAVPSTALRFRMGLQEIILPNSAGGSAVMDGDTAGIFANYEFNEHAGLTAWWMRVANDNFTGEKDGNGENSPRRANYLDNLDLVGLSLPLKFDGLEITPWAMYGFMGANALAGNAEWNEDLNRVRWNEYDEGWDAADGMLPNNLLGWHPGMNLADDARLKKAPGAYSSMFFAGLPIAITAFDPLNIEFDFNYGDVGGQGTYGVKRRNSDTDIISADTRRSGYLLKALAEYKFDWGTPGIFGWYASGDDGNPKNGSERMPFIHGHAEFTSFIGESNGDYPVMDNMLDWCMSYSGTWGIGLRLSDVSFVEDISHTFRVAWWGGTNSPEMVKYMGGKTSWNNGYGGPGPYLTTNDGLLEFNLDTEYKIYDNLTAGLELGYVVNMVDRGTWDRQWMQEERSAQFQDAWKAQLLFTYSF